MVKPHNELWQSVVRSFWAGVLILLPLILSIVVIWWLFNTLTAWLPWPLFELMAGPAPRPYRESVIRVLGLIFTLAFITAVGWATRLVIGRKIHSKLESLLLQVPLLNWLYPFFKEVSQTLLGKDKTGFDRVVLIEYPRPGIYVIAFVTSEAEGEVQVKTRSRIINLFLPTTPNPTSGFLLMVPRESVIPLEMTVAEGMKLVISGGSIVPRYPVAAPAPPTAEVP